MDLRYLVQTFDRRLLFGSDFPEAPITDAVRLFGELAAWNGSGKNRKRGQPEPGTFAVLGDRKWKTRTGKNTFAGTKGG